MTCRDNKYVHQAPTQYLTRESFRQWRTFPPICCSLTPFTAFFFALVIFAFYVSYNIISPTYQSKWRTSPWGHNHSLKSWDPVPSHTQAFIYTKWLMAIKQRVCHKVTCPSWIKAMHSSKRWALNQARACNSLSHLNLISTFREFQSKITLWYHWTVVLCNVCTENSVYRPSRNLN